MNRRPIFQAVRELRGGVSFSLADVRILDAAIDEALRPGSIAPAPAGRGNLPASPGLNKWQAMVDTDLLFLAFPANRREVLAEWTEPTQATCLHWGIDTLREIASFLANINVESAGLTRLTESLNYSTDALVEKFGRHRISIADARRYGRGPGRSANQEALANILYGGEFGRRDLGNVDPGDGWRHIGYGPKQITGRANQTAFALAMGIAPDAAPDYLRTKVGGMMGAGWFWKTHGLDAKASTPGVQDDRIAINGGIFGLPQVEATFDDLIEEMLRREAHAA